MSHKIYTRAPETMTDLDQIEAALKLMDLHRRRPTRSRPAALHPPRR